MIDYYYSQNYENEEDVTAITDTQDVALLDLTDKS